MKVHGGYSHGPRGKRETGCCVNLESQHVDHGRGAQVALPKNEGLGLCGMCAWHLEHTLDKLGLGALREHGPGLLCACSTVGAKKWAVSILHSLHK